MSAGSGEVSIPYDAFKKSLMINGSIFGASLVAFGLLVHMLPQFYARRTAALGQNAYLVHKYKLGSRNIFTRLKAVLLDTEEADIYEIQNGDAYIALLIIRTTVILIAVVTILGVAVILPVNFLLSKDINASPLAPTTPKSSGLLYLSASQDVLNTKHASQNLLGRSSDTPPIAKVAGIVDDVFLSLSMAAIPDGHAIIFLHAFVMWIISLTVWALMYYTHYHVYRWKTFFYTRNCIRNYSVRYENLPSELMDEESLHTYLENLFGDAKVVHITFQRMCPHVEELSKKLDRYIDYYETCRNKNRAHLLQLTDGTSPVRRCTMRLGFLGLFGEKVDGEYYCQHKIRELQAKYNRCTTRDQVTTKTAFVTFDSLQSAVLAVQAKYYQNPSVCKATHAPDVEDIRWSHSEVKRLKRRSARVLGLQVSIGIILLWGFIIVAVQAVTQLENLGEYLTVIFNFVSANPELASFVQGLISPTIISILTSMVPLILLLVSQMSLHHTKSSTLLSQLRLLFIFNIINKFFLIALSLSLYTLFSDALKNVNGLFSQFAIAVCHASFFINFVILLGFTTLSLELLQVGPIVLYLLQRYLLFLPDHKKKRLLNPMACNIGTSILGNHLLVFTIAMAFSVIAPAILPLALFFFCYSYFVYKHQLTYVYQQKFDSGGLFWSTYLFSVFFALLVGQLLLISIMQVKSATIQVFLLSPTPLLTIILYFSSNRIAPKNGNTFVPLELARVRDLAYKKESASQPQQQSSNDSALEPPSHRIGSDFHLADLDEGSLKTLSSRSHMETADPLAFSETSPCRPNEDQHRAIADSKHPSLPESLNQIRNYYTRSAMKRKEYVFESEEHSCAATQATSNLLSDSVMRQEHTSQ